MIHGDGRLFDRSFNHDARRPFLLPSVNARLRMMALILLSLVGEVGLAVDSLPDRSVDEFDDSEEDLLCFSSARISSKETLR